MTISSEIKKILTPLNCPVCGKKPEYPYLIKYPDFLSPDSGEIKIKCDTKNCVFGDKLEISIKCNRNLSMMIVYMKDLLIKEWNNVVNEYIKNKDEK